MAKCRTILILLLAVIARQGAAEDAQPETIYRRFQYKNSFKGPHLIDRNGGVPFWTVNGSAIASEDQVRLTPSIRSKKGAMWNTLLFDSSNWEVEMKFRVSGRGRIGADGLALWFRESAAEEGEVFGVSDQWKGLGVFLDSYDNDNQDNNPFITAMSNDGTRTYDHATDGSSGQLGGCLRDFRNLPAPAHIKVTYFNKKLTVMYSHGSTAVANYEVCFQVDYIDLPQKGYFGLSSATGGLADDHDVLSFLTTSLSTMPFKESAGQELKIEDLDKFEKSYTEYSDKIAAQRRQYEKDHPDKFRDEQEKFETPEERSVRLTLERQEELKRMISEVKMRVDRLPAGVVSSQPGINGAPSPAVQALNQQVTARLAEMLNKQAAAGNILEQLRNRPPSTGGATHPDPLPQLMEMSQSLESLRNEVQRLQQTAPVKSASCEQPYCASTTMVIGLALLQLVLFAAFTVIQRRQQAAAAKKFF